METEIGAEDMTDPQLMLLVGLAYVLYVGAILLAYELLS